MTIAKRLWDHFEEYLVVPMLALSACIIFLQVVMRYIFHNSLSWSEELARFLFIWEIWLGVSYATKKQTQLRITIVRDRLPKVLYHTVELAVTAVWFVFGVFLVVKGFDMCARVAALGQRSTALRIPMQYVYVSIPIGALLMDIRLIEILVHMFRGFLKKGEGEEA